MALPVITSLYAAPLGLMMVALSSHVTMLRAKAGVSIMDGGNVALAGRIRHALALPRNSSETAFLESRLASLEA
jgi:uncharacterized membrane protein YecN with MAPEG domain